MRKLACSWLLLLTFYLPAATQDLPTAARHSHFQYIYQITNKEALCFLKKGRISPGDVSLFHTKVDSVPFHEPLPELTEAGHYLLVKLIENEVQVELKSVDNTNIHLLNNRRDLSLMITDLQGNSLNHLVVRAGNRVIPFDAATGSFRKKKSNASGWLTFEYQGHLHIFDLNKSHNQGFFSRIGNFLATKTPAGVFSDIIQLAEFAISIPLDLYKFIDYPYFDDALYDIGEKYAAFFGFGEYRAEIEYSGYMVLNKPQYRRGETVKYKAYLVNQHGKAANGRANLVIWIPRKGKTILQQIESYSPGGFEGSFVLHDSLDLKLDTYYRISLERLNGKQLFSENFRYADYELGNIQLSVVYPQSYHFRGHNLELQITGKDENDLPLYDARLEIAVYPRKVNKFFSDQIFVPDTLLKKDLALDAGAPTPFVIADTLFPEINLDYEVLVRLISHDNQKRENRINLQFFHKKEELEYRLHDSLITFHFRENGISKEVKATLLYQDQNGLTGQSKEVELPYTEKINPGIYQYKLICKGLSETLRPEFWDAGISLKEERSHEEVMLRVNNPRNIPFAWFLYKNDKEVANGEGTEFYLKEPASCNDNYLLSIHYLWAGKMSWLRQNSVFQPGQLTIEVNQPERVFPGQKATIEIEVKDAWGKPANDLDLTAFAWTKKFNENPPTIQGTIHRWHDISTFNTFTAGRQQNKINLYAARKSAFWFSEAGLDTMPYFQFRFPGKDFFTTSVETFSGETQFAPFVFRNGWEVPIHVVYVNNKPVYTSLANHARPWSFKGEPGYNHIRIRTRNNEIVIDSLFLETGKKTFFSLDLNNNQSLTTQKARPRISRSERSLLFPQLFAFQLSNNTTTWIDYGTGIVFLNQGERNRFSFRAWNETLAGPLFIDTARVSSEAAHSYRIPLDHNFKYWIDPLGIKEVQPFNPGPLQRYWSGHGSKLGKLNDEFLTLELLKENQRIREENTNVPRFDYRFPRTTTKGNGTLFVERAFDEEIIKKFGHPLHALLWPENNRNIQVYPGPQHMFHDVSEGKYAVIYVFRENHYIKSVPFHVKGRGQNYIRFDFIESPAVDVETERLVLPMLTGLMSFPFAGWLMFFSPELMQRPESLKPLATFTERIPLEGRTRTDELVSYDIGRGNTVTGLLQGTVFDASDGSTLPGVSITIKGTSTGVVTNMDGNFSINVSAGQILVASFIGMKSHEFRAVNETHIIFLAPETLALEEVVVVGYGTRSQLSLSGAASGIRIRGASSIYGSRAADPEALMAFLADQGLSLPTPDQPDITSPLEAFVMPDFAGWEPGAQSGSIRSNFSDYAYWQPRLRTNAEGKACFEVNFPDDVTFWQTFVYAMNEKRQSGRHVGGIQSFQALMAQLSLPRFLIEGDTSHAIGRITSYLQDTLNVSAYFELAGQQIKSVHHQVFQTAIDTLLMTTATRDSLQVKYHLEYSGFVDGEERKIPVMPRGLEKTLGHFWSLKADSTFSLSFDQSLGEVSLYAKTNALELFLDDIERLIRFPYNCNEQEASRLIGLLTKKEIYALTGKRFWQEGRIRATISDLLKNQNSEGLWGWWGNSPHSSIWMSEHVLKALAMASEKGYEVNFARPITIGMLAFYGEKDLPLRERASLIRIMLMHGYEAEYDKMIRQLAARDTRNELFYELAELNQLAGIEPTARAVLDSAKHTFFGNMYFAGKGNPMSFWGTNTTNTLAAYRIFNRTGESYQEYLEPIFSYLLEVRDVSFPASTYFTSNMIYSIMPTLLEMAATGDRAARIELSGPVDSLASEFPLELRFSPEKMLQVKKTGASPVYLTTYQRYWEANPTTESGDIKVHTWFEGVSEPNKLEAAREVSLKISVTLEKPAEYLMLAVPIPAGCSYAENQPRGSGVVHREQWRNQTTLFFNRLAPGTYTYEIKLLPRFSGTYTLNPAKAELMYFPVFNANNEMRKVVIE